jgi:glycosyltransferase involved in cell wall biosynthesis
MSTISIVIPVYNEQDHLKDCLKAISRQTVAPDEVIVVDNNSTDDSVKVAASFDFVKVLNEPRQGVLYARTKGFNRARGDIIGRIDADTVLDPKWVERVKSNLKNQRIAAVTGPSFFYDMPFAPYNYLVEHMFKAPLHKYEKNYPFLAGNNMAIRKEVWNKIKDTLCERRDVHEDIDIAIHLSEQDYVIKYDAKLIAGVSARRADDNPKNFYRYMRMQRSSFLAHGASPIGARVAMLGYIMGYMLFAPLRRAYDPTTNKRTLKQLIRGHEARKNPMD